MPTQLRAREEREPRTDGLGMTRQARRGLVVEGRVEFSTVIAVFLRPWRRRGGRLSNEPLHVRLTLGQQVPIGAFVAVPHNT